MTPPWNQQFSCSGSNQQWNTHWNKLNGTGKRIKTKPVPNCSELARNSLFRCSDPLVKETRNTLQAGRRFTSLRALPKRPAFRVARNRSFRAAVVGAKAA